MAGSRKRRRKGVGSLDPHPDDKKDVHISAAASRDKITLSYSFLDTREHKKPRKQPPLTGAVSEPPALKSQSKRCNQVCSI
jgi:hypothetical protein